MKRFIFLLLYFFYSCTIYALSVRKCDLKLQSLWQELQNIKESSITFHGKWIHAGTITFRKKIVGPITLHTLVLHWHGNTIENLEASLYYTEVNKPFLAIDENWISDGQWSSGSQKLTFKFKEPCTLCAITTFHLVLTVSLEVEPILKKGYFTLSPCTLPQQYQDIQEESRKLSFCTFPFQIVG